MAQQRLGWGKPGMLKKVSRLKAGGVGTSLAPGLTVLSAFPGHPLQRLPEDQAVYAGRVPVRLVLPDRGPGGRGPVAATQCHHRDQAAQ